MAFKPQTATKPWLRRAALCVPSQATRRRSARIFNQSTIPWGFLVTTLPAFIELPSDRFKAVENCSLDELKAAERLQVQHRKTGNGYAGDDYLRGIRRAIKHFYPSTPSNVVRVDPGRWGR